MAAYVVALGAARCAKAGAKMMPTECIDCGADVPWPYIRCENCMRTAIQKAQEFRRKVGLEKPLFVRSEASLNVLALTLEDRFFLSEMRVSCE